MPANLNIRTAAELADLIPPLWVKKVRSDVMAKEFFGKMSGPEGSNSAVITKENFVKEPGDTLTFLVESELYGTGVTGESTLSGNEEKPSTHQFGVPLTLYRHAEAVSRLAQKEALVNSIVRAGGRLARWIAVKRDDIAFSELLSPGTTNLGTQAQYYTTVSAPTPTTLYGGAATSIATLSNTCRFSLDEIDKAKLALVRKGTKPIELRASKTGEVLPVFVCVIDEVSAYRLFSNTAFRTAVQSMLPRSYDHPLVTGALGMWNGVLITQYTSILQGCHQGTPLRPECSTYGATTSNRSADTILVVGANDGRDYTKNFPSSGNLEVNVAGTCTTYAYTGKTNYSFTGISATLAQDIADGCRVTRENHASTCIFLGAEAMARAWAEKDASISQVEDYGMRLGVGIEGIWGNRVIQDSTGDAPNHLLLNVYADSPHHAV